MHQDLMSVYMTQFYKTVDVRTFIQIHSIGSLFSIGKDEWIGQVSA